MRRFFVPRDSISGDTAVITGGDVRHLRDVLRLGPGDEILILDGYGNQYVSRIARISQDEVYCAIISASRRTSDPSVNVILVQGLPKSDKMDIIVRAGTELGVSHFHPVITERTVARPDVEAASKKVARLSRIAVEASKQSGRATIPAVHDICNLSEAIRGKHIPPAAADCIWIVPWELEENAGLRQGLRLLECTGDHTTPEVPGTVVCFIGPEGGLTRDEVLMIRDAGGISVSLGPRILRTETAAISVIAAVLYEFGQLGG
ncbi:MAG TPA: 16S rRNA (uracil(1498)-N(3))-methyltransferase [Firmicutes bacterium]|nr:16S rRNA (uracil(1498)-N(3))-methyltransferase [Bacillota bacterium]HHY99334.1 16S rRNA (uracil(1498)-N(3))-methyltransferase [Bacillota bacterium]